MGTERQRIAPSQKKRRRRRGGSSPAGPILLVVGAIALVALALVAALQGSGGSGSAGSKGPNVPVEVSGRPSLKVDQTVIDFGRLPLDRPVEAKFLIANVGDQPLRITGKPTISVVEGC